MIRIVVCLVLASCGRVGFDPLGEAGTSGDDASGDGVGLIDAIVCTNDDGVCLVECVGMDNDCATTCGDSVCVGNASEKCAACAECNTQAPVCGNSLCDGTETSATCETDCGPAVWPWTQQAADLLIEINNMRTAGVMCPGGNRPAVGALAMGPDPSRGAEQLAWQAAHQPVAISSLTTCNGVEYLSLINAAGYSGGAFASGATAQGVITTMRTGTSCDRLMMGGYSEASIGVAMDVASRWMVFLR